MGSVLRFDEMSSGLFFQNFTFHHLALTPMSLSCVLIPSHLNLDQTDPLLPLLRQLVRHLQHRRLANRFQFNDQADGAKRSSTSERLQAPRPIQIGRVYGELMARELRPRPQHLVARELRPLHRRLEPM